MAPRVINRAQNNCTPMKFLPLLPAALKIAPAIGGPVKFAILLIPGCISSGKLRRNVETETYFVPYPIEFLTPWDLVKPQEICLEVMVPRDRKKRLPKVSIGMPVE